MADERTVRHAGITGIPVQSVEATVIEGPDAGKQASARSEKLTVGSARDNDLQLSDETVSRYHVELWGSPEGVRVYDPGSTNGTWVGAVRVQSGVVPPSSILKLGKTTLRLGQGEPLTLALHKDEVLAGLRGHSPLMRRLMAQLQRAAGRDASVLLVGESGTGKELCARALHDLGPRRDKPFVTVDCGALSPTLIASELFGHEKGAFTGADRAHTGAFADADGGTLFLDEIGELPPPLQITLLGVLERGRFKRVGGRAEIAVDVRVVSATNRDLRAEVNAGSFRLDLYYRLAVVCLLVPPLRDHPDDVPLLVQHFLRECGHDGAVEDVVAPATLQSWTQHHWPGNVRELRNLVEATLTMGEPPLLDDSPSPTGGDPFGSLLPLGYKQARAKLLYDFEERYLTSLLQRSDGNVSRAAREARMDRSHLIDLLQRHGKKP
jgi:DNA-binding NtrC family response regulator